MVRPRGTDSTVLLAGATGLTGSLALTDLLNRNDRQVVVVARRPLPVEDPQLRTLIAELGTVESLAPVPARAALCALGTTIKKAGSQAAFRAVDFDGVLAFARWAHRGGARRFVAVSSVGASPTAGNFYLRVKGEMELALAQLGFERRRGEAIAQAMAPVLNPLLAGPLKKYRAIEASAVAHALVAAVDGPPGTEIWEHERLRRGH